MRGSGGTDGGVSLFAFGLLLAVGGVYFFFDSVRVTTGHAGALSGMFGGGGGHGRMIDTTSMGILFVPFFVGVFALFVNCASQVGLVSDVHRSGHFGNRNSEPNSIHHGHQTDPPAGHVRDVRRRLRFDVPLVSRRVRDVN